MRNATHISKFKHSAGILLGLLAAVVILTSQSFYFEYVSKVEGNIKTEQSSDDSENSEEQVIKMSHQALSSALEFSVQSVLHFITQIYEENSIETPSIGKNLSGFTSYFRTLFRLIISPNAP